MENGRYDPLEWLGPDESLRVFNCLNDPADLARAAAVSKSWRNFVISNEFGKRLCMKLCPEISNFTVDVELVDKHTSQPLQEDSSSRTSEWPIPKKEHVVYTYLAHCVLTHDSDKACGLTCIGASSTDNFPGESIENTLEPGNFVKMRPSYWSSGGQADPDKQEECLAYQLESDLCIISEIKIQPFKAFFQPGDRIYSAQRVRFRLGHSVYKLSAIRPFHEETERLITRDYNYVWSYISPEYIMSQDDNLQVFKLPRPVLCIGGVLKIELLGGVQAHEFDGLYYICVCHVQVIGRPASPFLNVATSAIHTVLRYRPEGIMRSAASES